MLVLSRRAGEEIIINGNIKVAIITVKGDRVRLGITAPDNVPVDRAEVHARRSQFFDVPISALSSSDSSVALGEVACLADPTSDTIVH